MVKIFCDILTIYGESGFFRLMTKQVFVAFDGLFMVRMGTVFKSFNFMEIFKGVKIDG